MAKVNSYQSMVNGQKVLVALSGGVDSAVAAYLLKKQGYDVRAVFMKNFSVPVGAKTDCPWEEDQKEASKVSEHLDISLETWNFERAYHDRVVDYMVTEYQRGRTPNPDVMCNSVIKFGVFLSQAKKEGYELIATGHYAGVQKDRAGIHHLFKGRDANKDQSYFLAGLTQAQLKHVMFPLAKYTKPMVRALAKKIKLPNAARKDSQGICFVGKVAMADFLKIWIRPKRGAIVDAQGSVLGTHSGVYYYTIGQRRGIRIGGGPALYVIDKDVKRNQLVVGTKDQLDLFKKQITVKQWHWVARPRALPLKAKAKIRYRQDEQPVVIAIRPGRRSNLRGKPHDTVKELRAIFSSPQRAVSPGQTIAVYTGRELIGSGVID